MTRLPYFKAYDLRGTVPEEIDTGVAWRLGRALPGWAAAGDFVFGRDARLSSPALAEALIRGLVEAGARVRDMGMVTTPMLNFAVARRRCHGVMVTASAQRPRAAPVEACSSTASSPSTASILPRTSARRP